MKNADNQVSDLGLAASLSASGLKIIKVDKSNPRRVIFVFDETPRLYECVEQYWSNELLLPAPLLIENIRQLKSRIYG